MNRIISKVLGKFEYVCKEQMAAYFLQDFIQNKPYLPHTISSLSLRGMHSVINDLVINQRTSMLEFGSGLSTIIFARAIKQNNLPATVISVDENNGWQAIVKRYLENEGLLDVVHLINAPLVKSPLIEAAWCYDQQVIEPVIAGKKFDSVLIDGPSGWQKNRLNSRVPVLDIFEHCLYDNYAIFIDNADRKGEKLLSANILARLKTNRIPLTNTFHIHVKNKNFSFHY